VCTAPCTLPRQSPAGIGTPAEGNKELIHPSPQNRAATAGGSCVLDGVKEPWDKNK